MSASTAPVVSPDGNGTAPLTLDPNQTRDARRRAVVITRKKTSTEMTAGGGINGIMDDKVTSGEKDLRHTIRGESVLERPKDLSDVKKGLVGSNIAPRRKKSTPKSEKPRWRVLLSVLAKTFLLILALLWLGQLISKWINLLGHSGNQPFAALDYEGRILEVEASLKKAATMLQVQLEVVDKKIGHEIGAASRELKKQVEEKASLLEKELKSLEGRTDDLDKSLSELKMDFLSKEEFQSFSDELRSRKLGGRDHDVSLDDIRELAKEIVEKEIEKHAADGLGRVDYALASGGAKVVRHSEPYVVGKTSNWFVATKGRYGVHGNAHKMLEPSFGEPGQCFALQGSSGFVEIRLRTGIIPEAVTLEHVSKNVAYDRSSAPKDCRVFGWFEGPDDDSSDMTEKLFLTEFSYDLDKSNAQTFNLEINNSRVINMVGFDFTSNHGSSSLTCIYRFRVHGSEPNSVAAMALEA